jgi:hypothetical protein
MKTIYRAVRNADQCEGRGPLVSIAYFSEESDAKRAAKGQGVMGHGDGGVEVIHVFDSLKEWNVEKQQELKRQALNKLTPDERKALGVE